MVYAAPMVQITHNLNATRMVTAHVDHAAIHALLQLVCVCVLVVTPQTHEKKHATPLHNYTKSYTHDCMAISFYL